MPTQHHKGPKHYKHAHHPKKSIIPGPDLPLFAFIILGFAVVILVGVVLLILPASNVNDKSTGSLDAFFTATSATTDTGLVTVTTADHWSRFGQTVIMVLIQIGGLGFMLFSSAVILLARRRVNLLDFRFQDTLGASNFRSFFILFLQVIALTIAMEALGIYLFWREFRDAGIDDPLWHSVFYSISSFNNAGFDLSTTNSLISYAHTPYILMSVAGLVIIGGISVPVIYELLKGFKPRDLALDTKLALITTFLLLVGGTAVIFALEHGNHSTLGGLNSVDQASNSFFMSVIPRTAGFTSLDLGAVKDATLTFIIFLMFIGGVSGSTAGGIKINTFSVLFLTATSYIRGRTRVVAFRQQVPEVEIHRAVSILFFSVACIMIVIFALSALEDASFIDLSFETVSAFSTVGLSTGITPALTTASKLILCLTMFVGRLGPLVMIMALARPSLITEENYPEAKMRIG